MSGHDQQTAGRSPGTTFPMQSVDVLLPTDEDDFIFGHESVLRSALPGTLAARADFTHYPEPNRSLFASMIVGQSLWARTAELSCRVVDLATSRPWQSDGDFALLDHELQTWEMNLPSRHAFSPFTLKVMRSQHLDLVCLPHLSYPNNDRALCLPPCFYDFPTLFCAAHICHG